MELPGKLSNLDKKCQNVCWFGLCFVVLSFFYSVSKREPKAKQRIWEAISSDRKMPSRWSSSAPPRPSDSSNWISYKKGIKDYIYHGSKKESLLASCVYVVTLHSASILWCKSKYLVNRLWSKIAKKIYIYYTYMFSLSSEIRGVNFKKWPKWPSGSPRYLP